MRHSISLECVRYRLRPVTLEDAPFIVELRQDPTLSRYVHEISTRVEDQVSWLEKYFERPDDYYFIVEDADSREPHGTIGIYDFGSDQNAAEWGRWILKRDSMAALESVWLLCEIGFSKLGLSKLITRTLAENERVISFHNSFGAEQGEELKDYFLIRGERKSAIQHSLTSAQWPAVRDSRYSTISKMARRAQ